MAVTIPLTDPEGVLIELFSRTGDRVCEDARRTLEEEQGNWQFALRVVDVSHPGDGGTLARISMFEEFLTCAPVVKINRVIRFRGGLDRDLFRAVLIGMGAVPVPPDKG